MPVVKNPKDQMQEQPKIDLTPMIDCVFQLIIFFMLVIDMSQQNIEDLMLPMSSQAVKDENPEEGRLYVNIRRKGEYVMTRQDLSIDAIEQELRSRVDLPRPKGLPVRDDMGLAERPVLIRADKATEFKHVQKVMYKCGLEGLRIWKVELAAGQVDENQGKTP